MFWLYYIVGDDYDVASQLDDTDTAPMVIRLIVSLVFLIPLMYISMGHSMLAWPLPDFFAKSVTGGITQELLALVIMIINSHFFINDFKGLVHRSPNMDTLVAIGSGASFGYSVYSLAINSGHHLYFESAAMILVLITVGKILESYSKGKTTNALKGLMSLAPSTATVVRDGAQVVVPVQDVAVGDIFVVKAGDSVPVDGMMCSHCEATVKKAFESLPQVDSAIADHTANTVELMLNTDLDDTTIKSVVEKAGYKYFG